MNNMIRSLVLVALVLVSIGLGRAEEKAAEPVYALTVVVDYKVAKDSPWDGPKEQRYVVPEFLEDFVQVPIIYADDRLILSVQLIRDQSGKIKNVDAGLGTIPTEKDTASVTIGRFFIPYAPGKTVTVLDGKNGLTVQVDEVKKP